MFNMDYYIPYLMQILSGISSIGLLALALYDFWKNRPRIRETRKVLTLLSAGFLLAGFTIALAMMPMLISTKPIILITKPDYQVICSSCSGQPCRIEVGGSSRYVFTDPNLRIFILVNPSRSPAKREWFEQWWVQRPSAKAISGGKWSAHAFLAGDRGNAPPVDGTLFRILAIVVNYDTLKLDKRDFVTLSDIDAFDGVVARSEIRDIIVRTI